MKTRFSKINKLIWITVFVPGLMLLSCNSKQANNNVSLPFSASVTIRPLDLDAFQLLYQDSPIRQVVMDGGVWMIGTQPSPYHNPITVPRWKGPDFEHMVRQQDGAADFLQRTSSSFISSGLWYDKTSGTLYAIMHGEYETNFNAMAKNNEYSDYGDIGRVYPGSAWCRKKTWLATSTDLGLHWTFVGDVVTAVLPELFTRVEYSGSEFEMGPADFDLYVDTRGGYFYLTFWNGFVAKKGIMNKLTAGTMQVARCAISDKMAPGKWYKFNNGTWTEPGLGGKASQVGLTSYGIYGNTIYSTYLQKYLRIGINIGTGDPRWPVLGLKDKSVYISTCTDLSRQDWTPMAKLVDDPDNQLFGFTLTDGDGVDPSVCGQTLHAYNYWEKSGRILDITLGKGVMNAAPFPPYGSYSYESHPESGDRIESRQTKIVGCASAEMRYAGSGWSFESNPIYYKGQVNKCSLAGNSVEFSFFGADIYWRAIAAQDGGKADVYIDNQFQTTVDLYFWDTPLAFQFAFIKTGLDPTAIHTIKIVARGDKNEKSGGTIINHMAFEYSAESYWASAGFSSVTGKNNWHYQSKAGTVYSDLIFEADSNRWSKEGKCIVGNNYQVPEGNNDAVRKWVAPHDGNVRIEGAPVIQGMHTDGFGLSVLKNDQELWITRLISPDTEGLSHDTTVVVRMGDAIAFTVHDPRSTKKSELPQKDQRINKGQILWDPVITYVTAPDNVTVHNEP